MFFVSVDSKELSFSVSPLFSALTSRSASVDSKGLALHENLLMRGFSSALFNTKEPLGFGDNPKRKSGSKAAAHFRSIARYLS